LQKDSLTVSARAGLPDEASALLYLIGSIGHPFRDGMSEQVLSIIDFKLSKNC
jgi:hypothetical protein